MADVTIKQCDVFRGKPAKRYAVIVAEVPDPEPDHLEVVFHGGSATIPAGHTSYHADLSLRALDRLRRFIAKATHPPGWKLPKPAPSWTPGDKAEALDTAGAE